MTVLAFALFVAAVVVMVAVHVALERRSLRRDEARQHALYKQHKALTQRIAAAERATAKLIDQSRTVHDDAKHLVSVADGLLRDPRVHRALKEGE